MIIHGTMDELIHHSHSEQLFNACAAKKKKLWLAEEAGHEVLGPLRFTYNSNLMLILKK